MAKKNLQKTFEHDMSILPFDIMCSIFIWLPINSLFRFQFVSKSWKAMISDRKFQKIHRDHSKALGREKLLLRQSCNSGFVFRDLESPQLVTMDDEKQLLFPPKRFQYSEVSCSCDGLVLLKNPTAYKYYLLWNPPTREYRILECPYVKYKDDPPNACGLCYDSTIDDYKVVLIFRFFYAVYSLSNQSWTRKTSSPDLVQPYTTIYYAKGISTQDCIYWSMNKIIDQQVDTTSTIIYFDVNTDEVKKLPIPNLHFVGEEEFFCLTKVNGCLGLYGGKNVSKELHIWVMEQDDWKWLLNICNLPTTCRLFVLERQLLHYTKNGEVLFQGYGDGITIYYPKRQQFVTLLKEYLSVASICLDTLYFLKPPLMRKRKQSTIPIAT